MSWPFLNTAPGYDEELRNSVFFERGLHATSICGAVGAAVAVAMLQGQDEAGIASAAGIEASMGAGLLEANRTGGTVKRAHCGWAARGGVAAADLARQGLTGPPTDWELPRVVFKPYPCNHLHGRGTRGPRRGQPPRLRQPPVRRGAGEELPRQRREVPPGGARGRARGPNARPS
jgi:MmgE/PrpD N-terminal domain